MKKFSLFILLFFILINNGFSASTYIPPAASSVTNIGFGLVGDGQSTPLTVDTNSVASIEKMTNYISNLKTIITVLPDDGYTNKISYGNGRHFFIKTTNEVGSFVTLDASFDENVSESIILEIRGTNLTLAAVNGEITGWATNDIPFADNKTISVKLNKPYMETNWTWSIFE